MEYQIQDCVVLFFQYNITNYENNNNIENSDSDECDVNNGQCEQDCTNNVGSFQCSCRKGFILEGNGFNCTGVAVIA